MFAVISVVLRRWGRVIGSYCGVPALDRRKAPFAAWERHAIQIVKIGGECKMPYAAHSLPCRANGTKEGMAFCRRMLKNGFRQANPKGAPFGGGKDRPMRYHTPPSFEDAARLAANAPGVTRFLAGGTDVLVQLRAAMVLPDDLIDLKKIPGTGDITRTDDGGWRIGVAVSGAQLGAHAGLKADWPGVVEGMELVGSTQVQGRATLTGNLCNGSPAADSVPGLIAARAVVEITGPSGTRTVAVEDIPTGPGRTSLGKGEVISAILLPPRGAGGGDCYLRFIPRTEMDIAVVGCAVSLTVDGGVVKDARVALGAVAPTVRLVPDAAKAIIGTRLEDAALDALARAAEAACAPIDDKRGTIAFRTEVAGVLARRAARIAYDRALGGKK
jgi:xanthine dehydrogenase FAD-binding subunit